MAESSDLSAWPRPRDCLPPVAESKAIAVCAAIGERGRCFVTDEDTEYRKRTVSNAAALSARKISGTATGRVLASNLLYNNFIFIRTWLSLVERLLWEQDAAGSNPVVRTKSPEFAFAKSGLFVCTANYAMRHLASKARNLLWAKTRCAAGGRCSRAFCVQRSIKSRKCVSPKILSGTANRC